MVITPVAFLAPLEGRCTDPWWTADPSLGSDHWGRSKRTTENVQHIQLLTEQTGTVVTLQIRIREVLGSNSGRDAGYPNRVFRGFP